MAVPEQNKPTLAAHF